MDLPRREGEEERVYSDDKEEEEEQEDEVEVEEDEEEEMIMASSSSNILPFSSPSSSSSAKYQNFFAEHHQVPGSFEFHLQQDHNKGQELPSLNFERSNNKLEFMDLTLGSSNSNSNMEADDDTPAGSGSGGAIEREHMFDKVVTPSDVGKLNRLVIPKQHAEKYFPLDASSNEKGLLLNFEDRNGKPWRFRYSYWNSSQSYVMTKGWSRFVKEKKLDAGDIVSFQRGVGESGKHRLFIDWRRRPSAAPDPTPFAHLDLHNQQHFPQSVRWGRLYSLPQALHMPRQYGELPHQLQQHQQHLMNYCIQPYLHPQYHHHYHHHQQQPMSYSNAAAGAQYHSSSSSSSGRQVLPGDHQIGAVMHQQEGDHSPVVIDSMPVLHGKTVGKRFRLFGVNMECPMQDESSSPVTSTMMAAMNPPPQYGKGGTLVSPHLASPCPLHLQPRVPGSSSAQQPSTMQAQELSKKGKTSLSFDLDL